MPADNTPNELPHADFTPFAYRKMIGGLIHDNNAIAESNRPRNFERLLFAPREQGDLIIHINRVPQSEIVDDLRAGFTDLFLVKKWQAKDALDRFSPQEIITSNR